MKVVANSFEEFKEKLVNNEIDTSQFVSSKPDSERIRLNVILRKQNISLKDAIKFLQSKGIKIKKSPVTIVPKEVYELILSEYSAYQQSQRNRNKQKKVKKNKSVKTLQETLLHRKTQKKEDNKPLFSGKYIQFRGKHTTEILWEDIIFEDKKIIIKIDKVRTNSIPYNFSRNSFNYLKVFFIVNKVPKIRAIYTDNILFGIENTESFENYIKSDVPLKEIDNQELEYKQVFGNYSQPSESFLKGCKNLFNLSVYRGRFICTLELSLSKSVFCGGFLTFFTTGFSSLQM